jgi:hypothetical protein
MSKGEVVASILVSILLTSGLVYFVVPIFAPTPGTILQIQTKTTTSTAVLWDTHTTWEAIPEMNLTIQARGNSRLLVTLECPFHIELDSGLSAGVSLAFNVSLTVVGVAEYNTTIVYMTPIAITVVSIIPTPKSLTLFVPSVAAGTYLIIARWISLNPHSGLGMLKATSGTVYHMPRTLSVQKIAL